MAVPSQPLPDVGGQNSTEEPKVRDALQELQQILDGSSVGVAAANLSSDLAAPIYSAYRTIFEAHFMIRDWDQAGTRFPSTIPQGSQGGAPVSTAGDMLSSAGDRDFSPIFFPFDPADLAVPGKTLKLRLRVGLIVNTVAPGRNFTFAINPFTVNSGSTPDYIPLTAGAAVTGSSVVKNAPGASSITNVAGADFTAPAAGLYVPTVNLSGVPAADSVIVAKTIVQARYV